MEFLLYIQGENPNVLRKVSNTLKNNNSELIANVVVLQYNNLYLVFYTTIEVS